MNSHKGLQACLLLPSLNYFPGRDLAAHGAVKCRSFSKASILILAGILCVAGTKHGVGTPFTKLYALAFAQAASKNINSAAFTIARIAVGALTHHTRGPGHYVSYYTTEGTGCLGDCLGLALAMDPNLDGWGWIARVLSDLQ